MARKHNVNVEALERMVAAIKGDPAKGKRTNRVEGTWNFKEGSPQFTADIAFEGGKLTLEADQPTFLGGGGTRPGPVIYALYGLTSCFTATFVTTAAMMGLELEEVKASTEADLNFARVFGVADLPIIEEVRVSLQVKGPAPWEKVEEALRLAEERCPAAYCLQNPIRLVAKVSALAAA